jgi:PPOX class probable F420-dependent enzyme
MTVRTAAPDQQVADSTIPAELLDLLRKPSTAFIATTMPDGSPQLTQVWVDTDGQHVVVNSVTTHVKVRNIENDPRVALTVADSDDPSSYYQVRGRVVERTTDGAVEHIEMLSRKYLGTPYPWYGGRDQVRVKLVIAPDHVSAMR